MYCVYCGERVNVQATFCPRCGKPFRREATPVAVECLSCHARNPDDAVYCWQCGRLLKREEAVLPFILPGAIAGPGQAAGTVPTVQGTPQMGGVPSLPGTPQTSGGLAAGSAPPAGNVSGGVAGSGNFAAGAGGPDNLPGGVTGPHAGNFSGGLAPSTGAPVGNLSGGVAPFKPPHPNPQQGSLPRPPGTRPSSQPLHSRDGDGQGGQHEQHRPSKPTKHPQATHATRLPSAVPKILLGLPTKLVLIAVLAVVVGGGLSTALVLSRSHAPSTPAGSTSTNTVSTSTNAYFTREQAREQRLPHQTVLK